MAQYIDKTAVIAEIENRIKGLKDCHANTVAGYAGEISGLERLLSFINTLEVKEVDLEKEIKKEYLERRCYGGKNNILVILNELQFNEIAKHFFELGLKAQKGE